MASIPVLVVLLVVIWIVLELVAKFVREDTIHYDTRYLWDRYDIPPDQYLHKSNRDKIGPPM
jgi:sorbitol-specific phosphotransferase system component IIC